MKYGKIKKGDIVKFTDEAKREIKRAVDDKYHKVIRIDSTEDSEHVEFEDGNGSDTYWPYVVRGQNER